MAAALLGAITEALTHRLKEPAERHDGSTTPPGWSGSDNALKQKRSEVS